MNTAYELHWSTVTNGELICLAEQGGFEDLRPKAPRQCKAVRLTLFS